MKAKVSKTLNFLLQIVIMLVTYWFIYKQVIRKFDTSSIIPAINEKLMDSNFQILLAIAFLLMLPNIGIEAQKWRFLIGKFENISFSRAIRAVFTGITVSVFTPNRIGEYFGRVFILKKLHPFKAVLVTIIGSMAQLLTTLLIGSASLIFVLPQVLLKLEIPGKLVYWGVVLTIIIVMILVVLLYLNFLGVPELGRRLFPALKTKIENYTDVFSHYNTSALVYTIFLSAIRYLVFSAQFIILLSAFDVRLPFIHYLAAIPLIFLAITVIPTIALTELGIRGSVSIFILSFFLENANNATENQALSVLAASTVLWLINLAIPALTGTLFVFNHRFIKSKLNDKAQ